MRIRLITCGMLLCYAGNSTAQSIIEQIGWQGASLKVALALGALVLAISAFFLFLHFRRNMVQQIEAKENAGHLFLAAIDNAKLTNLETGKLEKLLTHERVMESHVIFQSVSLFERCMDAEVQKLQAQKLAADALEAEEELLGSIRKKLGFSFLPFEHPLVSTRNISIGQRGSIFGKSTRSPLIHNAIVTDNKEFYFTLQYNENKEEPFVGAVGSRIKFAFARENDGFYGIALIVKSTGTGTLDVLHTLDLKRNQLRQFARIEANIPIRFRLIKTEHIETSEVIKGELVEAKISDISGGGLSFLCEKSLKPGDTISANFTLPNAPLAGIAAKVMRISLQEGKTKTYYKHHLQFISLDAQKQERIVKFVFEKQRQVNQWR